LIECQAGEAEFLRCCPNGETTPEFVMTSTLDPGARTEHHPTGRGEMAYQLEGRLLEVCTCNVLCPFTFAVEKGKGTLRIGSTIEAEMAPFQGGTGKPTTLLDSVFSTIPRAPAYVGKAASFKARNPLLGFDINLQDHNAIQGHFHFVV
jgi:hypothetical protein